MEEATEHLMVLLPAPMEPEKEYPVPVPETEELSVKQKLVAMEDACGIDDKKNFVARNAGAFKEESTKVCDLSDGENRALEELKHLVREAIDQGQFSVTVLNVKSSGSVVMPSDKAVESEGKKADSAKQHEGMLIREDDGGDGTRTVEAIKESIVAVSSSLVAPYQDKATDPPEEEELSLGDTKPDNGSFHHNERPEVSIWGVPLLLDERSDVILLKFLRAREFNVRDAFIMISDTIKWRKEFGIDELMEEDLSCGVDFEKVVFMDGHDKEGHPVCYNVYGKFQDKELYHKVLSDEERRHQFLRWRIQFLERSVRKLNFTPGGVSTILQVNDLKDSPGLGKRELRQATRQALQILQDNYPEFLAKQLFINVPWWHLAFYKMLSPFLTQRTKSKFVFTGPSRTAETLYRFIGAEQLPVKYGGLSKDGEFGAQDAITTVTIKPASKHTIEIPINKDGFPVWELRVVGSEAKYGAEFVPSAEDSYTVIIQKPRKVAADDEAAILDRFKSGEHGKVIITIENPTTKKKMLIYRFKVTYPTSC